MSRLLFSTLYVCVCVSIRVHFHFRFVRYWLNFSRGFVVHSSDTRNPTVITSEAYRVRRARLKFVSPLGWGLKTRGKRQTVRQTIQHEGMQHGSRKTKKQIFSDIYIYIYTGIKTHIYVYTFLTFIQIFSDTHIYICVCECVCVFVCARARTRVCVMTYIYIYVLHLIYMHDSV